jgi:tetratricopeptide (TPR) repeat protein
MQAAANISRFLTGIFSFGKFADLQRAFSYDEFYQQIASGLIKGFYTKQAIGELGNRLITLADNAYSYRRMETVKQVSTLLMNTPLPRQYESIAGYYRALLAKRQGKIAEARMLLDRVAEEAPLRYRIRAMMSIGAIYFDSRDFQSALYLYIEAGRAATFTKRFDPTIAVVLNKMPCILKSIDGDHRGALADLEKVFPSIQRAAPQCAPLWFDYLNSLAVELAEVGRLEEARNASRIALASPFASAYPEWRETWDDIESRGYRTARSFVSLNHRTLNTSNVLRLPLAERGHSPGSDKYARSHLQQQASITSLQEWKRKMVKEPNGDQKNDSPSQDLDDRQMLLKIVELSTVKGLPDEALKEMVDAIEKIVAKYIKSDSDA